MAGWNTNATLNGNAIEPGGNFRTTVTAKAAQLGYTNFRVLLNGSELDVGGAPELVNAGAVIEVRPFDKAGKKAGKSSS